MLHVINFQKEINVTENSSGLKALQNPEEWFIDAPDEDAVVRFENGNIYEGHMNKLVMNGNGNFTWADGTYYEVYIYVSLRIRIIRIIFRASLRMDILQAKE